MKASDYVKGLIRRLEQTQRRTRHRREMLELDDRILRDIGLSREELLREASKPFWKA